MGWGWRFQCFPINTQHPGPQQEDCEWAQVGQHLAAPRQAWEIFMGSL